MRLGGDDKSFVVWRSGLGPDRIRRGYYYDEMLTRREICAGGFRKFLGDATGLEAPSI